MTTAEVRQAMAVIKPALQAAKPEVPEGQAPTTVPGWRELRDAWSAYYQLQRYFGLIDPLPLADDAPGAIHIGDPSRVDKWVSLPGDFTLGPPPQSALRHP
jgi:hypothetical protein